ncbi:GNAT family N-acetyltransferase [Nocardia sp. NPDC127579]|uniref:GNAT family N-acetyltransferase n=1 Tax=Nocardia sp. NPDC127579 TaxID=3345402 RepID=UPI00363AD4E4
MRLHGASVVLRPPRIGDFAEWRCIRLRDQRLIEPFWTSSPLSWPERHTGKLWVREVFDARSDARTGRRLGAVIEVDGRFAGQIELGSLSAGTGELGIWVDATLARHGVGGLAVAMMLDFGFQVAGLHRITAPISPANHGTSAGAAALGLRREARMARYFDAGGQRRDHDLWAILASDLPAGGATEGWLTRHTEGAPMPQGTPEPAATLSHWSIAVAVGRYYAGRVRHLLDPLRAADRVRLTDPAHPEVVLRTRRWSDRTQWSRLTAPTGHRAPLPARWLRPTAPGADTRRSERTAAQTRPHRTRTIPRWSRPTLGVAAGPPSGSAHWIREFLCARAGLSSPAGLVLAVELDGNYIGEARLFGLDMFDRNAHLNVWTHPPRPRVRETVQRLLIAYGFDTLGLRRIATEIAPADAVSAEIATRVGMLREGRMRDHTGPTGHRADHDLWAITRPE